MPTIPQAMIAPTNTYLAIIQTKKTTSGKNPMWLNNKTFMFLAK